VDDFTVKYMGIDNAHHLLDALLRDYEITIDWGGTIYSGMIVKRDYKNCTCEMFMT
jgi:hypothetical protein